MTDQDLLTLCAFQEANLEPDEGVAAVVRVVLNRTRLHYESDGTIAGTIERHAQFSWTQYAMQSGQYEDVAPTFAEELERIQTLLSATEGYTHAWARCSDIAASVQARTFSGPLYDQLTDQTVLYDNLALAKPYWVASSKLQVVIGHHSFFEPVPPPIAPAVATNDPSPIDQFKSAIGSLGC